MRDVLRKPLQRYSSRIFCLECQFCADFSGAEMNSVDAEADLPLILRPSCVFVQIKRTQTHHTLLDAPRTNNVSFFPPSSKLPN